MIEYDKLEKSLKHLELQYINYQQMRNKTDVEELIQEAVKESVIQRFEVCFDSLWKVLKRYLSEEMGVSDMPNSPKEIFRIANENKLFSSSIEQWLKYLQFRVDTSHDYSENKADIALESMGDYIADAIELYMKMTGKAWERA
jgi:nucleotidyltransferase substrate binding protein (TIGR01987 family)